MVSMWSGYQRKGAEGNNNVAEVSEKYLLMMHRTYARLSAFARLGNDFGKAWELSVASRPTGKQV